jgi:hypothetical protein
LPGRRQQAPLRDDQAAARAQALRELPSHQARVRGEAIRARLWADLNSPDPGMREAAKNALARL